MAPLLTGEQPLSHHWPQAKHSSVCTNARGFQGGKTGWTSSWLSCSWLLVNPIQLWSFQPVQPPGIIYLYCHFSPEALSHGCLVSSGFRIVVLRHWHTSESPRRLVKTDCQAQRFCSSRAGNLHFYQVPRGGHAAGLGTTLWEPLSWKKSPALTFKISLTYQALEKNWT